MTSTLPELAGDGDAYVDAVLALLDTRQVGMVLPAHDGSMEALRSRRTELVGRCALPLASDAALAVAMSKPRTLALAADLGIPVPQSIPVADVADLRDALKSVGLPAVLKPAHSWVLDMDGVGTRVGCGLVQSPDEAKLALEWMLSVGGSALVQPWLPGAREAVTLFYAEGRFWARFAQVSHREWPALGGVSVLCESIPLRPDITESSERLIEAMALEGCAMVEFRRDQDGRPVLMEVNARMGGTVGLAVRSGVNIPRLVYAWGMGQPLEAVNGYRVGQRLRWLVGDMWYLNTAFDRRPHPDVPQPAAALKTVLSDFVVRPSRLDFGSLTDPHPALIEAQALLKQHAGPRVFRWLS